MSKIIGLIIGIALIGGIVFAFSQGKVQDQIKVDSSRSTSQNQSLDTEKFKIPQDTVGYFYSEYCSWCQKQKPILEELEKIGYKFTRIDVTKEQERAKFFEVTGTPTFLMSSGEKHSGYLDKDQLQTWIDSNK